MSHLREGAATRRDGAVGVFSRRVGTVLAGIDAGLAVFEYTLACRTGMRVSVWSYGATLVEFSVPNRAAQCRNWVLRLPEFADYHNPTLNPNHLGATLGRYARCVRNGRFALDGYEVQLRCNLGNHHFHGGPQGFDKRVWSASPQLTATEASVVFSLTSANGDQGYPGTLTARCVYSLDDAGVLDIRFEAETDAPTLVGLTNHAYWNLAGVDGLAGHRLWIAADRVVEAGADHMPTGRLPPAVSVWPSGTTPLGARALDHCFVLASAAVSACLEHSPSGSRLEVCTDHPALAIHIGETLPIAGCGVALQPTELPDAPNHPHFKSAILWPGQTYRRLTRYRAVVGTA